MITASLICGSAFGNVPLPCHSIIANLILKKDEIVPHLESLVSQESIVSSRDVRRITSLESLVLLQHGLSICRSRKIFPWSHLYFWRIVADFLNRLTCSLLFLEVDLEYFVSIFRAAFLPFHDRTRSTTSVCLSWTLDTVDFLQTLVDGHRRCGLR